MFWHCKSMANTNKCPSGFWTKKSRRNRKIPFLRLLKGYSFHFCTFCHPKWKDHHPIIFHKKWKFFAFSWTFFNRPHYSGIAFLILTIFLLQVLSETCWSFGKTSSCFFNLRRWSFILPSHISGTRYSVIYSMSLQVTKLK